MRVWQVPQPPSGAGGNGLMGASVGVGKSDVGPTRPAWAWAQAGTCRLPASTGPSIGRRLPVADSASAAGASGAGGWASAPDGASPAASHVDRHGSGSVCPWHR